MTKNRRDFIKKTSLSAIGAAIAVPSIASADSKKTFRWKMTNCYGAGAPFYSKGPGSAEYFCKRVEELSNKRLRIKHYPAGELIPAMEGFDAVSKGTIQMNWGNSFFWAGKTFAAQYFTAVPFGMNFQGTNAWLQFGGGQELWDEVYKPFNVIGLAAGNTGVQMTGWFKKEIKSVEDLKGLRMRVPGLAGKVLEQLGVGVKLLPGGEIFPALERGVIDAAEFVGPFQDRRMGLHKAAKNYYTTGWGEPSNTTECLINKDAWNALPEDLKAIVKSVAAECNLMGLSWSEANNSEALKDLVDNEGVIARTLPDSVIKKLKEVTFKTYDNLTAKDPLVKKVHDSYFAFKAMHDDWQNKSEEVVMTKLSS
ncbi:ABC transporter substrate-binding protein [Halarcobacter mediterraneus]|uniref:ABC transporter substrate-binding protein n=1 Tax=Halarcobacter mediterraneus TaxID=2023153 RepID=A0A4Q1B038_9BACT|nr:TRAP transporter substrate-binding protein [Halarcobacter mediterraneus]RXK11804.1 ABC transporter substrate-binding protein [Halarcobacter mediterraneus]